MSGKNSLQEYYDRFKQWIVDYKTWVKDHKKTTGSIVATTTLTMETLYRVATGELDAIGERVGAIATGTASSVGFYYQEEAKVKERERIKAEKIREQRALEAAIREKEALKKWYKKYKPLSDFEETFSNMYDQAGAYTEAERMVETVNFIKDLELEKTEAVHNAKKGLKYFGIDERIIDISELAKIYIDNPLDGLEETIAQTLVANDIKHYIEMTLNGDLDKGQLKGMLRRLRKNDNGS